MLLMGIKRSRKPMKHIGDCTDLKSSLLHCIDILCSSPCIGSAETTHPTSMCVSSRASSFHSDFSHVLLGFPGCPLAHSDPLLLLQLWSAEPPLLEAELEALVPAVAWEEECAQSEEEASLGAAVGWEEECTMGASPPGVGGCVAPEVAPSFPLEHPRSGDVSPPQR